MQVIQGKKEIEIYNVNDFPYENFKGVRRVERGTKRYFDVVCAFDIETTTIHEEECNYFHSDFGFMYI